MSQKSRVASLLCALTVLAFLLAGPARAQMLTTVRIAAGLSRPVWVGSPPGDLSRLFIVEQHTGRVRIMKNGFLLPTPFLTVTGISTGNEQGLLGMAFHPNYAVNGFFYVNFTAAPSPGSTVVRRYRVSPANPDLADPASAQTVITFSQPYSNHNAGDLAFSPRDGFLYVGTGDGGSANDPGNRAQAIAGQLLGKMLRIDVDRDDFPADPNRNYGIPPTNPFAGPITGDDEIWAFGLRNPWRYSFDRVTGDLFIGDVGQNAREEVNFQPATSAGGENYGWRCMEGLLCTGLSGCTCNGATLVRPVHDFANPSQGCSVIGGYVYRGLAIPGFVGTYLFADYCSNLIWSFRLAGGQVTEYTNRTTELAPGGGIVINSISSFGQDPLGELYIVDLGGEIFRVLPRGPRLALGAPPAVGLTTPINLTSTATPSRDYVCGFSFGYLPGIPLPDGRTLPLNPDILLVLSLTPGNGVFGNTIGTLSAGGTATVTLALPNDPVLRGVVVFSACVVLVPTAPSGIEGVSPVLPITIE